MPSTGTGRRVGVTFTGAVIAARPELPRSAAADVSGDYFWGTGVAQPPPPLEIPICWFTAPVRLRLEPPVNVATATQPGGTSSRLVDKGSVAEFTVYPTSVALTSIIDADPANFTGWTIAYKAQPATRAPELHLDLMHRTDLERIRILGITRGRRIRITGVPDEFPVGAADLIVAGIGHEVGLARRRVRLTTQPVAGLVSGAPGPWFYLDSSATDSTDAVPF